MKPFLTTLTAGALCFVAGAVILARHYASRQERAAAQFAAAQAAWDSEKAELEAALAAARSRSRPSAPAAVPAPVAAAPTRPAPADIIARLQGLRGAAGSAGSPRVREAIYCLEELVQCGPDALPAVRQFLARNEEVELDPSGLRSLNPRGGLPAEPVIPPSVRLGLFDVVRRIAGADAQVILAETLSTTGRGLEVAYLTRCLHDMAPNHYRTMAVNAARALLANPLPLESTSALDRGHRDYLFAVLMFYRDGTFASEAQAQLVRADSQIDRSALKYLQQALGAQAVPLVAQAYQNPALATNAVAKEPLARLALSYVGADPQANAFYQQAINDPVLTKGHRSNLIEDLNEDGFADPKNLTAADLPLILNRLALIEQLAPNAMDDVNAAAFKEAYKDLVNMHIKVTGRPPATAAR